MILVVTNEQDITSDLVILRFQERGVPYIRFNTEDFPTEVGVSWHLRTGLQHGRLDHRRWRVELNEISAVWFRRPKAPRPSATIADDAARTFARDESLAALRSVWSLLDCLWVSRPDKVEWASHKLGQLQVASELGFEVPDSLVTTDPEDAQAFCRAHQSVIAKPLGRGYVEGNGRGDAVIYTNLLELADLDRLDTVTLAPTLFQAHVSKAFDLRVTVVGRRIFATEIHASGTQVGVVDWRRADITELPHYPHEVPADVAAQILKLVTRFGLQFGALDFIVTPDGRYVFLEINPNGQWAWIEQVIGTPISYAITELLSGEAEPL